MMDAYEKEHDFRYDYVMRFRTDTVLKDRIRFDWCDYTEETVQRMLDEITAKSKEPSSSSSFSSSSSLYPLSNEVLHRFMTSFFNEKRIHYGVNHLDNITQSKEYVELLEEGEGQICKLLEYIKRGKYINAFRVNVIYFIKRETMEKIHTLGITYGKYRLPNHTHWFDAESQLKQMCVENDIDFYSTVTPLEGASLYNYQVSNYFDEACDSPILKEDAPFSFFIKRS